MTIKPSAPPRIPALLKLQPIGSIGDLRVIRVDDSIAAATRKKVAQVAYVARRDMPKFKIAYDGWPTPQTLRMYVVAANALAVAMATVATTTHCWKLRWVSQEKVRLVSLEADRTPRPRVGQLWVCHEYRRRQIARNLIDQVCATEGIARADLGWQLPLTMNGLAFARKVSHHDWFGDGAEGDLEDLLAHPILCGDE